MSINSRSLKANLAYVVKTLTTKKVIWSNQNANTPNGEYKAANISSWRMLGATDWQGKPDSNEKAKTQGDREFVLTLIAVSENCEDILLDLIDKLNLNSSLDILSSKKLAYVDMDGDIANITTNINGSFETRASVDLVFRISKNYSSDTEDDVEIVQSIGISGGLSGGGTIDTIDIALTVSGG